MDNLGQPATRGDLSEAVTAVELKLLERLEKVETTLLLEFRKWALKIEPRQKVADIKLEALAERIAILEDEVTGLKGKHL